MVTVMQRGRKLSTYLAPRRMHTRVTMLTDHARRCSRAGASVADAYTQGIRPQVRAGTGRGASASSSCGTRTLAGRRCRTCSTRSRCPPARAGDAGIRRVPARRGSRTNGTAIMSGCTHSRSALPVGDLVDFADGDLTEGSRVVCLTRRDQVYPPGRSGPPATRTEGVDVSA